MALITYHYYNVSGNILTTTNFTFKVQGEVRSSTPIAEFDPFVAAGSIVATVSSDGKVIVGGMTTVGVTGNQTLGPSHKNQVIPTSTTSIITVNTGLGVGFGSAFVGSGVVTFIGTASVSDFRTTGATNPACVLVPIGFDTYAVYGSKA